MRPMQTLAAMCLAVAATAAAAASSDYLLTLPPGKGELTGKGEQLEVQSFQWGGAASAGHSMLGASDRVAADGSPPESGYMGRGLDIAAIDGQPASSAAGTLVLQASLRGCTLGRRYDGAQFAAGARRYELKDVVISNCAANSVSLDYSRVTVRGWDPDPKQH